MKTIGITIDYVLRQPQLIEVFYNFRKLIKGSPIDDPEFDKILPVFFQNEFKDKEKINFYIQASPDVNDKTFQWFYSPEHRIEFLKSFGFNCFTKGDAQNRKVAELLKIIQQELADVILIDRIQYPKKIQHTFAFLSKVNLPVKSVVFFSQEDKLQEYSKTLDWFYDPVSNPEQPGVEGEIIDEENNPIHEFSKFLYAIEEKE